VATGVFTVPPPDGIPSSRLLRQAAACEGIELDDPGGPLADPSQRDRLAAVTGWACDEVRDVVFVEPRADPRAAFAFVDSGFCEPLRTASTAVRERVWVRFETLYRAESTEHHVAQLVRLRPATQMQGLASSKNLASAFGAAPECQRLPSG